MPTHDGLTLIIAGWPYARIRGQQEGHRRQLPQGAGRWRPSLPSGCAAQSARRGSPARPCRISSASPYGAGWALVGDAGYNKDPITAQGINDAFRDAERCASALDQIFTGARSFDEAMGEYQRARDEQVLPMYEFTCELATLQPPPPADAAAVRRDPRQPGGHGRLRADERRDHLARGVHRRRRTSAPSWRPRRPLDRLRNDRVVFGAAPAARSPGRRWWQGPPAAPFRSSLQGQQNCSRWPGPRAGSCSPWRFLLPRPYLRRPPTRPPLVNRRRRPILPKRRFPRRRAAARPWRLGSPRRPRHRSPHPPSSAAPRRRWAQRPRAGPHRPWGRGRPPRRPRPGREPEGVIHGRELEAHPPSAGAPGSWPSAAVPRVAHVELGPVVHEEDAVRLARPLRMPR